MENRGFLIEIAVEDHPILQPSDLVGILDILRNLGSIRLANARKRLNSRVELIVVLIRCIRERFNRRLPKKPLQRKPNALLLRARQNLDAANRIAAELEKIVVNANLIHAQNVLPDFGQNLFVRTPRLDEFSL